MTENPEPDGGTETRTVRVLIDLTKKLQTIKALRDEMGKAFKSVEFLDGLIRPSVEELYEQTMREFAKYKAKKKP